MRKNVLYMWQSRSFFIIKLTDLHFVLRIGHKHGKHIVPKALKKQSHNKSYWFFDYNYIAFMEQRQDAVAVETMLTS